MFQGDAYHPRLGYKIYGNSYIVHANKLGNIMESTQKTILNGTAKYLVYITVLSVFIMLAGCQDNNEAEPEPLPIAEFTYTSTNNQNAPATVSFFNTVQIDVTYSWDFGNGETFEGRDPIITFKNEGTYSVTLTVTGEGGTAQKTKDIVIGPFTINTDLITGSWSIIREAVTTPGTATPVVHDRSMNWERLSFYDWGEYTRASLVWVEYEHGDYAINDNVITLNPTSGNDEFSSIDILITALDENSIEAEVDMVDPDKGTIHIEVQLKKLGPEYFGQGEFPMPSLLDFNGSKWSMSEETTTLFDYSEATGEYSSILSTETVSGIPYNFNTFLAEPGIESSIFINNWGSGTYERYYRLMQIHAQSIYWIDVEEDGNEIMLLITNNEDGNNIEVTSAGFYEIEGERFKFEAVTQFLRSDGSEPTITSEQFTGQWKVIAKTEIKDGVDVDPADSYTPPLGSMMVFNADGSAELGDPTPGSWYALDECNIIVVSPEGDETLVHVIGFDSTTGALNTFSRWTEDEFHYEMTLSLEKQ